MISQSAILQKDLSTMNCSCFLCSYDTLKLEKGSQKHIFKKRAEKNSSLQKRGDSLPNIEIQIKLGNNSD